MLSLQISVSVTFEISSNIQIFAERAVRSKNVFCKDINMRALMQMIVEHVAIRGGELARLTNKKCAEL